MASPRSASTRAYRIVSADYPPFDGAGAHRWGSRRRCNPGRWVVHAAETYALAVLENLVHWQASLLPRRLVCVEIQIPGELDQDRLDPATIAGWDEPDYVVSRESGDDWYDRGAAAVLWVPSVVSPYEHNVLFNQAHADFRRIRVGDPIPARIDPRVWPRST
jgi:RES domain-containing protein